MSQKVPILFRVKTLLLCIIDYWSVWVMKSSDWRGAAGLSVRVDKEWHDWPTDGLLSENLRSSASFANISDENSVSSSHPVSFLCELVNFFVWTFLYELRGVLRALTVLLWTFILDRYHRWWHHQEAGVLLTPNTHVSCLIWLPQLWSLSVGLCIREPRKCAPLPVCAENATGIMRGVQTSPSRKNNNRRGSEDSGFP